jgi:hypothetical protein
LLDGFKSPFQHCGASFAGGESCTALFGGNATPVSFNSEASQASSANNFGKYCDGFSS